MAKVEEFGNDAKGFVMAIVLSLCNDEFDLASTDDERMSSEVARSLLI